MADTTIRAEDWDGRDLLGERHEDVDFVDLDMTEVRDEGSVFSGCTFRGVRFNVSTHTEAAFLNCTFVRCNLFDARFVGCKLTGSVFDACEFDILRVEGGDWSFTALPKAGLSSASFTGVRMREADLSGADCAGATLREVDLSGAVLNRADLSRCDLRGSDLSSLDPLATTVKGAIIDPVQAVVLAATLGLEVRS